MSADDDGVCLEHTLSPCCLEIIRSVSQSSLFPTRSSSASSDAYWQTEGEPGRQWPLLSNYDERLSNKAVHKIIRMIEKLFNLHQLFKHSMVFRFRNHIRLFTLLMPWHHLSEHNFWKGLDRVMKNSWTNSVTAYLVDHFHPLGQVIKRLQLCDVIHEHDSLGPSVVGWCNAVEPLLASSVPYIQKVNKPLQANLTHNKRTVLNQQCSFTVLSAWQFLPGPHVSHKSGVLVAEERTGTQQYSGRATEGKGRCPETRPREDLSLSRHDTQWHENGTCWRAAVKQRWTKHQTTGQLWQEVPVMKSTHLPMHQSTHSKCDWIEPKLS